MDRLNILKAREVKQLKQQLFRSFGWTGKLEYAFLKNSQDKLYLVNKEAFDLDLEKLRIDKLGLYFGEVKGDELRLSIEGSQLIGPYAKHHVIPLESQQRQEWMAGKDIDAGEFSKGFVLLQDRETGDFLGCGKATERGILNFYPKTRRITT